MERGRDVHFAFGNRGEDAPTCACVCDGKMMLFCIIFAFKFEWNPDDDGGVGEEEEEEKKRREDECRCATSVLMMKRDDDDGDVGSDIRRSLKDYLYCSPATVVSD